MEISDVEKLQANKDVEGLIEALKDKDSYIRCRAAWALGNIKDARAVEPLIETLRDGYSYVRMGAVFTLGDIGDKKAVEPLTNTALKDKDKDVRREAAEALDKIKDERAIKPLMKALKDEDSNVRETAKAALEEMKPSKTMGCTFLILGFLMLIIMIFDIFTGFWPSRIGLTVLALIGVILISAGGGLIIRRRKQL